jgi:lipopolysaccharide export system protein LptA
MVTPLPHLPVLILVWAVFLVCAAGAADTLPPPDTTTADQPIHILADTLLVDTDASVAEFSGNVRASQEKMVILSDRLKIFYKKGTVSDTGTPGNEQSVKKIVAAGNVRIEFDNRVAVAEQAVYTSIDRVLMLTGEQVKVTGDNNTIAGEKIIIHREDGRMTVESGPEKRVEAVLTPGKNGIN